MKLFTLLIIFQIKHFLADYPLQTPYMLGKFKEEGWVGPLSAHAGVHAVFTMFIVLFYGNIVNNSNSLIVLVVAILAGLFDFVVHFTMDRIKSSPKMLGRYKNLSGMEYLSLLGQEQDLLSSKKDGDFIPLSEEDRKEYLDTIKERYKSNKLFWWSLGFDQAVHHITHYIIIGVLV